MKIILKDGTECFVTIEGAGQLSVPRVKSFFKSMNIDISEDFAEFYSEFNGGCGFPKICGVKDKDLSIEDRFYIDVYTPHELAESNDNADEHIDNAFFFASDGGEMEIGYDYVQNKYFWISYIVIGVEPLEYMGNSSEEFLNYLIEYFAD